MTHAWLIISHNQFEILQRLISFLDDERSDFFIHIDKKVQKLPEIQVHKGHVHFLRNRINVRWGTSSQIRTELILLEAAAEHGSYDYYHIISGTTLPLRPFPEVDEYFLLKEGKSVLTGLCKDETYQETLKIHRYNLFVKDFTSPVKWKSKTSQLLWRAAIAIQRLSGIRINRKGEYYKASNWLSLTEIAVWYILSQRRTIEKKYRWSFCGDEFFIPSELMASPELRGKIVNDEKYLKHDIGRANAGVFHLSDYPVLQQTGYLFARKFTA